MFGLEWGTDEFEDIDEVAAHIPHTNIYPGILTAALEDLHLFEAFYHFNYTPF